MEIKKANLCYSHYKGGWPDGVSLEIDLDIALNLHVGDIIVMSNEKNSWMCASCTNEDFEFFSGKELRVIDRVFWDKSLGIMVE